MIKKFLMFFQFAGFEIKNQTFGEFNTAPAHFAHAKNQGILGLAFVGSSKNRVKTVIETMEEQGILKEPSFSFFMNKYGFNLFYIF